MAINWGAALGGKGAKPAAAPSGGGINWGQALAKPYVGTTPAKPALALADQKVLKSFQTLDPKSRTDTLNRLQVSAKSGNADAARKLTYLLPAYKQNVPKEPDYTDKSLSGIAFRQSQGLAKLLLDPLVGGSAGEQNVVRNKAGKVTSFDAGQQVSQRDIALKGVEARLMYGKVPLTGKLPGFLGGGVEGGAVKSALGAKGVISAANKAGLYNAGAAVVGSTTSDHLPEVAGTSIGKTLGNIAKSGAEAYGTGFALGGGGKLAGKVVGKLATGTAGRINQFFDDPIDQVATKRVAAGHSGEARPAKVFDKAVADEVKKIKSDPIQKQAIVDAYKTGGEKALTVDTGLPSGHNPIKDVAQAIRTRVAKNGLLRNVEVSDKTTDTFNRKIEAPTTVDPTTRTIRVNPKVLQEDFDHLAAGKGITLPSGETLRVEEGKSISQVQNEYLDHLVKFEESHIKNASIGDVMDMRAGKQIGRQMDEKAMTYAKQDGKPTTAYHSSAANIVGELRASGHGVMGPGVYLHENPTVAREAGAMQADGNLLDQTAHKVNVTARKLFQAEGYPSDEKIASLKKQGYEGIRTADGEMVIFDPRHVNRSLAGKPVNQNVDETILENGQNNSSRSKHFDESLQKTLKGIEQAPGYKQNMTDRSGNAIQSHEETYSAAKQAGPLPDKALIEYKTGDPVDTVTTTRAHATAEAAARDLADMRESGVDTKSPEFQAAAERVSKMLVGYKMMTAESGRSLNIQGSFVDNAIKLQERIEKIETETKGATPEIRQKLVDKAIEKAKSELAQEKDLQPHVLRRLQDMLAEYATAAKLTSPLTHAVNIVSNIATLVPRAAENTLSTALGVATRKTGVGQAKYVFGTLQGLRTASTQFASDLKQAVNPLAEDVAGHSKSEIRPGAIPGKTGKVIRTPFNFLTASDNFFKNMLKDSELHQQAYAKGYQEGFRGSKLAGRIDELIKAPTEEMATRADNVAKEFTFQAEPGPIAEGISKILGKVPALRLLVPFVQTPTNIIKYHAQRSLPLGIFSPRNISALVKGTELDRREAISRLGVGAGLSAGGVMAAFSYGDKITGAAPAKAGEKDNFYSSGKKPYAVLIGGKWYQYNRFAPLGLYLTQAVGLRDALQRGDSKTAGNVFMSMTTTIAKGMADLPFISGVSNVIDALNNPSDEAAINKAFGGIITGLIPNIGRDIASAQDDLQRNAKTIGDQVKMMIPDIGQGLPNRKQVSTRLDSSGSPEKNSGSPFERGFLKIVSKDNPSKLTTALNSIGKETGYYPEPPAPKDKVQGKVLSSQDFDRYAALSGQKFSSRLEKVMGDSQYSELSADDKKKLVESLVSSARTDAANDLFGKPDKKKAHKNAVLRSLEKVSD